jgi:CrcB protein
MNILLAVAAGGALGAVGRYLLIGQVASWLGAGFPFGTLAANVIGSFVMGVLVEAGALFWSPSPELRAFLTVGLLGAFTTFSSFSLEVALLYQRGELGLAALYIAASVILCVLGLFLGLWLVRGVVA